MAKNTIPCNICGTPIKRNGSHVVTCENERCRAEQEKRSIQQYNEKERKKHFKNNPIVKEFLGKFNFSRKGFIQIEKYPRGLTTILTHFKEYLELDEKSRIKVVEI